MRRLASVLFWSVIAAAFIGPGTVTTAASAGATHGHALVWALVFSTVACLVLQEAAARITVVSGLNLGQALRRQYRHGFAGAATLLLVLGAIVFGCAAYEAGNILGGVAGAALGTGLSTRVLTLACVALAGLLLWFGAPGTVARCLSVFVAVMGVAFLATAWNLAPALDSLLLGAVVPRMPPDSGLLVLGLIGTTVVPYNLFLGSGLARGQSLSELRFGLAVAVILGGLISIGIVVVGAAVDGDFSFEALADVLVRRLGPWARRLFAVGLWAAGVSSAITAPLAAAITARSLFADREPQLWSDRAWRFRAVWGVVLAAGALFGLAGVKPIPAILVAQALNGVLLPLVTIFLWLAVNDRRLMGTKGLSRAPANALLGVVVVATTLLGLTNVARAGAAALGYSAPGERPLLAGSLVVIALAGWPLVRAVRARRRGPDGDREERRPADSTGVAQ